MSSIPEEPVDPYATVPTFWQRNPTLGWGLAVFAATAVMTVVAFPGFNMAEAAYLLVAPAALWAYRKPKFRHYAAAVLGAQVVAWTILLGWLHNVTWVGLFLLGPFIGLLVGFLGSTGYWIAAALIVLYGIAIWLDSSSLTAGAAGSADPARRGATLAVHSMLGYAGGFVGPLMMGWVLDLSGGMSPLAWGLAFGSVAVTMALALVAFAVLRPAELMGEGGAAAAR